MAEPPEFWSFLVSNLIVFVIGLGLTGLSARAYWRLRKPSLGSATVGFALITLGAVSDALYDLGTRGVGTRGGIYGIGSRDLLLLHTTQSVLLALGLAALFYSLRQRR
jgi:hypothetical protein